MNNVYMSSLPARIRLTVDPMNPGQFFACCGVIELADRLWGSVAGWFEGGQFHVVPVDAGARDVSIQALISSLCNTRIQQLDMEDDTSSPMYIAGAFQLRLDWWKDKFSGGSRLKVWAGSMRPIRIAQAMQAAVARAPADGDVLFDFATVVFDTHENEKKVEPYYFDSRRGANALSRDIGFAPDALKMTTAAFPAVELLSLIGIQRCRPVATQRARVFDYYTWNVPRRPEILPAAVCGLLSSGRASHYRFENAFRTDQKKHKAFLPAELIGDQI